MKLVVEGRRLSDEIVFWVDRGDAYQVQLAGGEAGELMVVYRKLSTSWFKSDTYKKSNISIRMQVNMLVKAF